MVILTVQLAFSPSMEWSMSRWKASHGSEHSQCASSQVSFLYILHYILHTQYKRKHLIFFFSDRIVAHLTLPTCIPHSAHFVVKCRFNFFFMEYLCSLCVVRSCILAQFVLMHYAKVRTQKTSGTTVSQFVLDLGGTIWIFVQSWTIVQGSPP